MGAKVAPILSAKASAPPTAVWPVQRGMLRHVTGAVNAPQFRTAEPGAEAPGGGDRKVNSPARSLYLRLYGPKQAFGLRTARTREVKLLLKVSTKPLLKTTTHALDGMAAADVDGQ